MSVTWMLWTCHVVWNITFVKSTAVPCVGHVVVSWKTSKRKKTAWESRSYAANFAINNHLHLQIYSCIEVWKVTPNCCCCCCCCFWWIPLGPWCSPLSKFSRTLPLLLPLEPADTAGAFGMSKSQFMSHQYKNRIAFKLAKKLTFIY